MRKDRLGQDEIKCLAVKLAKAQMLFLIDQQLRLLSCKTILIDVVVTIFNGFRRDIDASVAPRLKIFDEKSTAPQLTTTNVEHAMLRFEAVCYEKVKLMAAHLVPKRAADPFVRDFCIPMSAVGVEIFVLIEKPAKLTILWTESF